MSGLRCMAVGGVLVVAVACSVPEAPPRENGGQVVLDARLTALEDELAAAESTIDRLQAALEQRRAADPPEGAGDRIALETELLAAQAMADRRKQAVDAATALVAEHRAGLDRCVAELNRVAASKRIVVGQGSGSSGGRAGSTWSSATPAPGAPAPSATPRRTVRKVRTLSAPLVSSAGEEVVISARLWNPDEEDQRVTIEIALLADGVEKDTETQTHLIPAHGDLAVASRHHLYGMYEGKALAGRVRVLD